MARRYTRDNRGRFASVGATARGGRLRTAAGNKRDTQTKAISGGKPGGTVGKPAGLKPQAALSSRVKMQTNAARTALQSKAAKDIAAAQQRLKTKRYGDTANQYQNLVMDRKVASMTPAQLAASRVRSARAMVQRGQRSLRDSINADAPVSWRTRMERSIADSRREFRAAAADYRLIKPRRSRK